MGSSDETVLPILYKDVSGVCTVADTTTETANYRFAGIDETRMCNYDDDRCVT